MRDRAATFAAVATTPMSDTQHEAAIRTAAAAPFGQEIWDKMGDRLRKNKIYDARLVIAAYDAARSGEAEGQLQEAAREALVVLAALKLGDVLERHAPELWDLLLRAHDLLLAALAEHLEPRQDQPVDRAEEALDGLKCRGCARSDEAGIGTYYSLTMHDLLDLVNEFSERGILHEAIEAWLEHRKTDPSGATPFEHRRSKRRQG